MIKLTYMVGANMGDLYVPENVVIVENNGKAKVTMPGIDGHWEVQESPEEVARKVLEYRLAMERYRTGYAEALQHSGDPQWIFENAELRLNELAGLAE